MKITKELKDIIRSRLRKMEEDERSKTMDVAIANRDAAEDELHNSPEYAAFVSAAAALEGAIDNLIGDDPLLTRSHLFRTEDIEGKKFISVGYMKGLRDKYEAIYDSIIIRLSYGENIDDLKAVLGEYGIDL